MPRGNTFWWGAVLAFLIACAVTGSIRTAEPAKAADAVTAEAGRGRSLGQANDAKDCLNCHDDPKVAGVLHTPHAVKGDPRTAFTTEGCQSCHGASEAHMAKPAEGQPRVAPEVVFAGAHPSPVTARNKLCLGCHETAAADHWQGSAHATADVACTSCHASHPAKDPVLVKTSQAPICFTCHAEQRAANLRPSHHPVIEGIMTCGDCHNPHGSDGPNLIKTATVNELCLTCHDEKRGPFLWEHAPVQEQCTICHTPHGSVQARLLKQRPPYLCQTCHEETLHNSQPMSGATLPGGAAASRIISLRACLNCHSEIHGSNHPSGIRFGR
jgi:DmsE family decaheme c-type cytochrome